jgi:hypothetical protein
MRTQLMQIVIRSYWMSNGERIKEKNGEKNPTIGNERGKMTHSQLLERLKCESK